MPDMLMRGTALFSEAPAPGAPPVYRYELRRIWDAARPPLVACMMNPSTADAEKNDATVERQVRRAIRLQVYGSLIVLNAFAFRTTYPRELRAARRAGVDIVGPDNDRAIEQVLIEVRERGGLVYGGWGPNGALDRRDRDIEALAALHGVRIHALALASGQPQHPLYLGYDLPFLPWSAP